MDYIPDQYDKNGAKLYNPHFGAFRKPYLFANIGGDKSQLSPYDPPDPIAGTPLPVESENPKERKMMKKMLKKDACAAAAATGATGAGATSIVEESLPHNCKGNCCRNEQENRKKVVCVLLLLFFLLFPTNSSIHSS